MSFISDNNIRLHMYMYTVCVKTCPRKMPSVVLIALMYIQYVTVSHKIAWKFYHSYNALFSVTIDRTEANISKRREGL